MKRSEVLAKLEEMLTFQRQDLNNGSDYQDAEAILDYLEHEVKMLPPLKEKCPVLFTNKAAWGKE